jgi:hypothetical protein
MRTPLSKELSPFCSAGGFVYVEEIEKGPMREAKVGSIIRNIDHGPPWIPVAHSLQSVTVARWPGKLWKVEIIEAAHEQPGPTALYTRAVAVRVLEEQPVSQLFGSHGATVCKVIEKARTLRLKDVQALGESTGSIMEDAYSRAWNAWLDHVDPNSIPHCEDHIGTLAIPRIAAWSPIGGGFCLLHSVPSDRARNLVGDSAFEIDDEGERSFTSEWRSACRALLSSAMAYGAPNLMSLADRELLLFAWIETFGEIEEQNCA